MPNSLAASHRTAATRLKSPLAACMRRLKQPLFALLLFAIALSSISALAQAAPAQQPQGAPPLPGSAESQMTQGRGPGPQAEKEPGGEANLRLPDLSTVEFRGVNGHKLLTYGLIICVLGLLFGLMIFVQLKNLAVHRSMREISELIYETCKTYLITQGKFILILEIFIAIVIVLYFGLLQSMGLQRVIIILLFSLVGIGGSYGVAWFGIRVNTFANSRTAFASLRGGKSRLPGNLAADNAERADERHPVRIEFGLVGGFAH